MQALDFEPDRLGAARGFAERLVERRPDDRIGLMTFASRTTLRCPLTRDREAVRTAIRDLTPGAELLGEGTALGAATLDAVERLASGVAGDRMLIVLSDGKSIRESVPTEEAAAVAAARQVRIHTVGIGSGGAVPYPTEFGRVDVVLPLDEAVLTAMATRSRGRYFRAPDEAALRAVSDAIDELESPAPVEVVEPRLFSVAPPWVLAALACVALESLLAATALRRFPE
jgi:Ca-activated chloride channel family protein